MGGLLSGKRILVGLLLTYALSVVYWTVGESFLVFLLFLGVFVGGYFIFVMYRREVAKSERVSFLNLKVKQLGGAPLDDVGSLMLDSTYKDLVTSLERSILDILARGVVSNHAKILLRKKSQKIYADDYGREISDEWMRELQYFAKNIFMPSLEREVIRHGMNFEEINVDLDVQSKFAVEHWVYAIDLDLAYKQDEQSAGCPDFEVELDLDEVVSGHDYEFFVSDLIRRAGWLATVTPGSGDHGADIIAELGGERVAVQCKYFSSPVGNKSVQEAYSAKGFYDCDHACVVTSSSFTPAAKKAAAKLGVSLLHHSEIERYFQSV